MMRGAGERLKGCAARTGTPALALDPLTRTPRLAVMPFRVGCVRRPECHLYFAHPSEFLSCADKRFSVARAG
jgi:hypothetical protein